MTNANGQIRDKGVSLMLEASGTMIASRDGIQVQETMIGTNYRMGRKIYLL